MTALWWLLAGSALVVRPFGASALTWSVSPTNTGLCSMADPNCTTIQSAISGASAGDLITVFPGTYTETAAVPSPPACGGDTVGLYIATNGLTIQGVDSGGAPITNPALVQATVNTISNLCFGPDGMLVTGDNVTIAGIRVGTNTGGQNKTIEIWGDNFTLENCDLADVQGSIYIQDPASTATTSHVQTYTIRGNIFENALSLDINNGAGLSGPASGRNITGNIFKNLATTLNSEPWPSISFTGSGTGVPWFVNSVGGAVISGNTFSNSAPDGQQIRVRGTYDNTQFDWATYWTANTFNKAAVVGASPPAVVETYSYPNSYGTFNNVRRIGAVIQGEVDHAQANDTVLVAAGNYAENVVIATTGLNLAGAGQGLSTVVPATSSPNPCTGSSLCGGAASNIILVQADNVSIHDFTLDGDNPNLTSGIVRDGADLDARNGVITDYRVADVHNLNVYNTTVQNVYLRGIYSSSATSGNTFSFSSNTVHNVQGDYSSIGMFAFAASGTMADNTVSDANDAISANWSQGIYFLNNTVTNSGSGVHTDNSGGSGSFFADQIEGNKISNCMAGGYGIFTFAPYISPSVRSNTISGCDVGLTASGGGGVLTTFADNVVDGMNRPGSVGVYVTTSEFGWGSANVNATFIGNLIQNTADGFQLQDKTCSVTSTQGCKTNSDCPAHETCTLGYTLTVNASCNRIADNGTGILTEALANPAGVVFSLAGNGNVIAGNGIGVDGSALPAGPALGVQDNFWGCAAGPGNPGCDTVIGNVDFAPVAAVAPTCAYCSADSECDDNLRCNGVEACDPNNHVCQTVLPAVNCSGLNDSCNVGTCIDPAGTCQAEPKTNGTTCGGGDSCQNGTCTGGFTLSLATVRLQRNTARIARYNNGSVSVLGVVNDEDTGGQLATNLVHGGVTVEVHDNVHFHTTINLTRCVQRGTRTIVCNDRTTRTSATFTKLPYYTASFGLLYKMSVSRTKLATADTGPGPLSGPVAVVLHQTGVDRPDSVNNCQAQGTSRMICRN